MKKCCLPLKENAFQWAYYTAAQQIPACWDEATQMPEYLKKENLLFNETLQLPAVANCYIAIFKDKKLIFCTAFQVLKLNQTHIEFEKLSWYKKIVESILKFWHPKLLVVGNLFRHDVKIIYYDLQQLSIVAAYELLNKVIQKICKKTAATACLIKDIDPVFTPYLLHKSNQYTLLKNDISMILSLRENWQSLTNYEKDLKHKYAQRYRKITQQRTYLNIVELNTDDAFLYKKNIYELYLQVAKKQTVRLGLLNEDFIPALKQRFPATFKIWLIFYENQPIAFASAWVRAELFDMFYIGMDYAFNERFHLYFNLLFLALEKAIELKTKQLILGRTALDAKARLGCTPQYLNTYLYFRARWMRCLFQKKYKNFNYAVPDWELRHPFSTRYLKDIRQS